VAILERTPILLIAVTRLRISEAVGLQWRDIDDENSQINVRRRLSSHTSDLSCLFPPQSLPSPSVGRAVASAALLTSYAASNWTRSENHLSVAQAWLAACITLLRFAAVQQLDRQIWSSTYEIAFEAARVSLAALSKEAAEAMDLVVPDIVQLSCRKTRRMPSRSPLSRCARPVRMYWP
jgi:hypothetical protein